MQTLIVVSDPRDWPLEVPGVEVVAASTYLTDPEYSRMRGCRIFNLCRSYRYQTTGYYVSLLAAARGHRPIPEIGTVVDLRSPGLVRFLGEDLELLIERSLAPIQSDQFVLSVYFGRNVAKRYDRLSWKLYNLFQAPLLRAHFARGPGGWQLRRMVPIPASEIPAGHHDFVVEVAATYFARASFARPRRKLAPYSLAILHDPDEQDPPSNAAALRRFARAAEREGLGAELIRKDDLGRLAEFDALFIRVTTQVNHYTYLFSRRAEREGLVVVDDTESILRCTNKVYLAELMTRRKIPIPRTLVVDKRNAARIEQEVGLPCVLKEPDSSFSRGVIKVGSPEECKRAVREMFEKSELVVAQEFLPSEFDWRVGVFEGQALYVCRYFMARKHWQIIDHGGQRKRYGRVETLAVEDAPPQVVRTALRAARAVGQGLYGVDLKQIGRRCCVIEVNDNPSIDAGYEDAVLKDELYARIMQGFRRRIEARKKNG